MACQSVQASCIEMRCSVLQLKAVDLSRTSQVSSLLKLQGWGGGKRFRQRRGLAVMQAGKSTLALAGLSLPFTSKDAPKAPETAPHVVQRGQVMSTIARLYNTDLRTLHELNPGVALDYVRPKQVIMVPKPGVATSTAAEIKGKPVKEKQGGLLSLPFAPEQQPHKQKELEASVAAVEQEVELPVAPQGPIEYRVQPGDSLFIIAEKYGVSMTEIVQLNNMHFKTPIKPRQVLLIPANSKPQAVTVASVCPAPPPICPAPTRQATSGWTIGLGLTIAAATVFCAYQYIKKTTSGGQVSAAASQPVSMSATIPQAASDVPIASVSSSSAELSLSATPPLFESVAAGQPMMPPQVPLAPLQPAAADLSEAATLSGPDARQEDTLASAVAQEVLASSSLEAPALDEAAAGTISKQSETDGAASEPSISNTASETAMREGAEAASPAVSADKIAPPPVSETAPQEVTLPPPSEATAEGSVPAPAEEAASTPVTKASNEEAAVSPVAAENTAAPPLPEVTEGESNAPLTAEAIEEAPSTAEATPAIPFMEVVPGDKAATTPAQATAEGSAAVTSEGTPQTPAVQATSEEEAAPLIPEVVAADMVAPEGPSAPLVPQATADVSAPAVLDGAHLAPAPASTTVQALSPSLIDILPDGLMPLENAQVAATQPQQTRDGQLGVGSSFRQDSTIMLALRGAYQMASASLGPKHQTLAFVALSSGRIGLASQDFTWGSTAEAVLALRTTLPSDCNLQGICTWGVNGADGNGAAKEEKSGVEWAAVLLFSAQGMVVSSGSTITTGSARLAAEMAAEGLRERGIGKNLKAVVIISSPQADESAVEVVRNVIPGLPVYAISESRMPDSPGRPISFGKEWQVAPSGAAGAVAPGISLVGISTEAEFGGAFFATVVGQWLYGPKCTIEALSPASTEQAATSVGLVKSN